MSNIALRVEELGKLYRIGQRGQYQLLCEALTNLGVTWSHWLSTLARPSVATDPQNHTRTGQHIWALKDINFEIKHGEVVGIIGRNGAGKSTLLKILSRITKPSTGFVKIRGRVGSLLEVGTGFHPELSGRENIYLNGAILGMRRAEIQRKFDEIVAFAEIEKFIDTPVKRYSSGMYLRLAFAVAAHLEPDILIVDEVLAVGDVAFQKKCLGKMGDVTAEGRTVLLVSHNMDVIQQMCPWCVMLDGGNLVTQGHSATVIAQYLSNYSYQTKPNERIDVSRLERAGTGEARFVEVQYSSLNREAEFRPYSNGPLEVLLTIDSDAPRPVGSLAVFLCSQLGTKLVNADTVLRGQVIELRQGSNQVKLKIENLHLNPGIYRLGLWLADPISSRANSAYDYLESAFEIEVMKPISEKSIPDPYGFVTCDFDVVEVA
jgi:lipopolysaccharide transport system ATP-binding protein